MNFTFEKQKKWCGPKDSPYKLDNHYREIQDDLNPCPMCGAKPHFIFPFRYDSNMNRSKIKCSNCGAYTVADTMYRAISDWNAQYIVTKEDNNEIYEYEANFFADDSMDYFYHRISCGHRVNGETIYALA